MALDNLITEFVLREGTDYGAQEMSLNAKKQSVIEKLHSNEAAIFFDKESNVCEIIATDEQDND